MIRRRGFLNTIGLGSLAALASPALALPRAAAHPLVGDLEIWRVPVNKRGDWILLGLGTDKGLTGVGDASHGGADAKTIGWLRRFAGLLRGRSIFDVEGFRAATAPILAKEKDAAAIVAASALEHCLWDLMGKALGVPTYDLLGGALRIAIPLYANINRSTDPRTPEGFARMAASAVADGFDAVKLAPFDAMPATLDRGADVTPLIDQGVAAAQAVRAAIGPKRKLLIDAHSRFARAEGLALAERLAPLDLYWLEEVTPADPLDDLVAINRAASMPTAGGESIRGVAGFYPYVRAGAVDVVMPDVKVCGGILELKKIAALAEAAGLPVSPHGPASPVGTVAAAHVSATLSNFTILEFAYGEVPWRAELIDPVEQVQGGKLQLGEAPGFGIRLDQRALARHGALLSSQM
jgi:galactonate dehydratase